MTKKIKFKIDTGSILFPKRVIFRLATGGAEVSDLETVEADPLRKETRERVENLWKTDNPYQKSVEDLAAKEGDFRAELLQSFLRLVGPNIDPKLIAKEVDALADKHSNEILEKMEAEKQRTIDPLTSLRSKAAYYEDVPKIIELVVRQMKGLEKLELGKKKDVAILALDLDHFKRVNDEHGHGAGDMALKALAEIIKDSVRNSDFAFRYGGEEFAVLLPNTDLNGAKKVAEKIRANVERTPIAIKTNDGQELEIKKTISIGVASLSQLPDWQEKSETDLTQLPKEIWNLADAALYQAKNSGRNQYQVFSPEMLQKKAA